MKRTMSKITASVIAIMIAFTVIVGTASNVFASTYYGNADFVMESDKTTVGPGTEIKVSLTLTDLNQDPNHAYKAAGIASLQMFFKWDPTLFEFVRVEKGARLNEIPANLYAYSTTTTDTLLNNGYAVITWSEVESADTTLNWRTKNLYPDDEILVLTLRVKSGITSETTTTVAYGNQVRYQTEFVWSNGSKIRHNIDTTGSQITIKPSVDFTAKYYDYGRTRELSAATTVSAVPGQAVSITAKNNITDWVAVGYEYNGTTTELAPQDFIPNVDVPVTFSQTNVTSGGTVNFLYKADNNNNKIPDEYEDYNVTSTYTGVDGTDNIIISPSKTTPVRFGLGYTETAPKITGWVIRSMKVDGIETERLDDSAYGPGKTPSLTATVADIQNPTTVEFFYDKDEDGDEIPDKIQKTMTTTFIGDDGTQNLAPTVVDKVIIGQNYTISSVQIPDWIIESYSIDGTVMQTLGSNDYDGTPKTLTANLTNVQADAAIQFVYTADNDGDEIPDKYQYLVTTKYTDEDGSTEIANRKNTEVYHNDSYTETSPSITGWVVESWILGTVEQGRYTQSDYKLNDEIFFTASLTGITEGKLIQFQYTEDANGDKIPDKYQNVGVIETYVDKATGATLSETRVPVVYGENYTKKADYFVADDGKLYVPVGYKLDGTEVIVNDLAAYQNNTLQEVVVTINNVTQEHRVEFLYYEAVKLDPDDPREPGGPDDPGYPGVPTTPTNPGEPPIVAPEPYTKKVNVTYQISDEDVDGVPFISILEQKEYRAIIGTTYQRVPKEFNGLTYGNGLLDGIVIAAANGAVTLANVNADHVIVYNYTINDPTSGKYRLWHFASSDYDVPIDEWCISNFDFRENLQSLKNNIGVEVGSLKYFNASGQEMVYNGVRLTTGCKVQHIYEGRVIKEFTVIIFGDIDKDGDFMPNDDVLTVGFIHFLVDLDASQIIAANYSRDAEGAVTISDLTMMRDYVNKFEPLNQWNIPGEDVPPLN